jgi:hypothetical protein
VSSATSQEVCQAQAKFWKKYRNQKYCKEILSLTQRIVNGPWDEEENVPERVPKESKPASGLVFGMLGIF